MKVIPTFGCARRPGTIEVSTEQVKSETVEDGESLAKLRHASVQNQTPAAGRRPLGSVVKGDVAEGDPVSTTNRP